MVCNGIAVLALLANRCRACSSKNCDPSALFSRQYTDVHALIDHLCEARALFHCVVCACGETDPFCKAYGLVSESAISCADVC